MADSDETLTKIAENPQLLVTMTEEQRSALAFMSSKLKEIKDREDAIIAKENIEIENGIKKALEIKNAAIESISDSKLPAEEIEIRKKKLAAHVDSCVEAARKERSLDGLNNNMEILQFGFVHSNTYKAQLAEREAEIAKLKDQTKQIDNKRSYEDSYPTKTSVVPDKRPKTEGSDPNAKMNPYDRYALHFKETGGLGNKVPVNMMAETSGKMHATVRKETTRK